MLGLLLALAGCGERDTDASTAGANVRDSIVSGDVVLATTTSVEDAGLLDTLLAPMRRDLPNLRLRVVAVGTGQALALGRRGDADLVIVHDPAAESAFVAQGHGQRRRALMRNDFVIAGPEDDPARVREAGNALEAFRRIANSGAPFLSRGDSSGTHAKELSLWDEAGGRPAGDWYLEVGVGMGDMLRMASERQAYALADRATYRYLRPSLDLAVLHDSDERLANPYSVIEVTRARNPHGARAFADWLVSPGTQQLIGRYGLDESGRPLFRPAARSP